MVGCTLEHTVAHLEVLLQHVGHNCISHLWTTLVCNCNTDLLRSPDVLMVAKAFLYLILDFLAQLLSGETLLLYLVYLIPAKLLVPN